MLRFENDGNMTGGTGGEYVGWAGTVSSPLASELPEAFFLNGLVSGCPWEPPGRNTVGIRLISPPTLSASVAPDLGGCALPPGLRTVGTRPMSPGCPPVADLFPSGLLSAQTLSSSMPDKLEKLWPGLKDRGTSPACPSGPPWRCCPSRSSFQPLVASEFMAEDQDGSRRTAGSRVAFAGRGFLVTISRGSLMNC